MCTNEAFKLEHNSLMALILNGEIYIPPQKIMMMLKFVLMILQSMRMEISTLLVVTVLGFQFKVFQLYRLIAMVAWVFFY